MTPVEFHEQNTVFAKNQPEYLPLPAHNGPGGRVTFCWRLTWRERLAVVFSGFIWQQVLTFNRPLQPQKLLTDKPELIPYVKKGVLV